MKAKRLLFLVMAICLTSGVKAQFYDSPDDIYYYVEEYYEHDEYKWSGSIFDKGYYTGRTLKEKPEENEEHVLIFNFDGTKAANLIGPDVGYRVSEIKSNYMKSSTFYEDKIESTEYNVMFVSSSSSETVYKYKTKYMNCTYTFSTDRNTLKMVRTSTDSHPHIWVYKRVNKSFFRVGRSRTPSRSLYE